MNYMLNIMYSIDNSDELSLPLSNIKFINIFLKNVAEMPLVQQVILFGSCATGGIHENSYQDAEETYSGAKSQVNYE